MARLRDAGLRRGTARTVLLGLVPSLLLGQLPPLPEAKPVVPGPSASELLPFRPFTPSGVDASRQPLRYRGQVSGGPEEGWTIEHGAVEGGDAESGQLLLLADRIYFHPKSDHLVATGHIRLEAPGLRLLAERLEMNVSTRVGSAQAVQLDLPPTWTLRSQKVQFTTLKHWEFDQVELSPCPEEKPGWSASLSDLKVDLDKFATFRNAKGFLGPVPFFYMPWGAYPAKLQRSSGLIQPEVNFSRSLGTHLGLSYYQVLGDTMDATVRPDFYSKEGMLWGGEYRWAPDATHQGSLSGQYIHQKSDELSRYRYNLKEFWQREDGWQFMADLNTASDSLLESDYGRGLRTSATNVFDSSFYIGKNFSRANVSLSGAQQRIYFQPDDTYWYDPSFPAYVQKRTLPQLQTRIYPISIGDFYLDGGIRSGRMGYALEENADSTSPNDGSSDKYNWARHDVMTHLQGRLGQFGPIRADLQMEGRYTYYGKTLHDPVFQTPEGADLPGDAGSDPFRVDGDALNRTLLSTKLQFSGTQIGRTFEHFSLLGYTGELKHVVEPYVALCENSKVHDEAYIPRFDDLDSRPGVDGTAMGEESIEFGLHQHMLGRPGKGTSFNDLVRWRVSMKYHFRPILLPDGRTKQGWSSLDNDIDIEPNRQLRVSFKRSSDLASNGGSDSSLSVDFLGDNGSKLSLAAFSTGLNSFQARQQGITLGGLQPILDDRFRLEYSANYDYRRHTFQSSQVSFAYVTPCVTASLRFSHLTDMNLPPGTTRPKEDRLDFVLTFRELGDMFGIGLF